MKTIVVIGATGHFGARICRRLLGEPNIRLIVTSRSVPRAESFSRELREVASNTVVVAAALDQFAADFERKLSKLEPDIVVHTAGPYQGQDYRVAEACIQCGSHYVDLADGREFVLGFSRLDEAARRRGVLLVSGASTLPGLSSAVVDLLEDRFDQIHAIRISIAPAHQTPRGQSTIAAVLSYCGKPFEVLSDGKRVTMYGWQNLEMQRYPFGARLSAACDVPDLVLLPDYVPQARTVTFHAALEAGWEQIALWLMAWLTRLRVVRDWGPAVPLFQRVGRRLARWGSDTGGMHVALAGIGKDGGPRSVTWYLTARQNHGPEIPCTPALIITRNLAAEQLSMTGARPCLGLILMSEFDREIGDLDIEWQVSE